MDSRLSPRVLLALTASLTACKSVDHVRWLAENTIPLRTIVPEDGEDLGDLEPLRGMIGDARVVLLGEPSHVDGGAIEANTRIVKFLHERMGFDVFALESDFYGCFKVQQRLQKGDTELATFQQCAFAVWGNSRAALPLWRYLGASAASERPIELLGFDCQPSSKAATKNLVTDLDRVLTLVDPPLLDEDTRARVYEAIARLSTYVARAHEKQREGDWQAIGALARALASPKLDGKLPVEERAMFHQLGASLVADEASEWLYQLEPPPTGDYFRSFNARDAQMADNLLWWINRRPGRKIIVWAAAGHLARGGELLRLHDPESGHVFMPMGQVVAERLQEPAPVIAFFAYQGTQGRPEHPPQPSPPAPEGTLEALLVHAGSSAASSTCGPRIGSPCRCRRRSAAGCSRSRR